MACRFWICPFFSTQQLVDSTLVVLTTILRPARKLSLVDQSPEIMQNAIVMSCDVIFGHVKRLLSVSRRLTFVLQQATFYM